MYACVQRHLGKRLSALECIVLYCYLFSMLELEIRIRNWSKVGTFYRLLLASPLKMCSKFVLANWIGWAKSLKVVRKWPVTDCYFKLWV